MSGEDDRRPGDSGRMDESRKILERIGREAETGGERFVQRAARRARKHLDGDADPDDWAERWGTRAGRAAGLVFSAGLLLWLLIHLATTE
jgi:hypothetical protein